MSVAARPTRPPRPRLAAAAAAGLVFAVATVAILARSRDSAPPSAFAGAYAGVCAAGELAAAGDPAAARARFTNDSHEPLHRLAAQATASGDRARAAHVLEAKESVEHALDGSAPQLAAALGELGAATAAAMEAVEGRAPEPCRR